MTTPKVNRSVAEAKTSALPSNVLRDVREFLIENRHDVKTNDDADFVIQNSTVTELFDMYLTWNGVIGYTEQFIEALDGIRAYVESSPVVEVPTVCIHNNPGSLVRLERSHDFICTDCKVMLREVRVQHKGGLVYVLLTPDLRVHRVRLGGDLLDITDGLRAGRIEGLGDIERKAVRKALRDEAREVR